MDIRNFGQLKGRIVKMNVGKDNKVWLLLSVLNIYKKTDTNYYETDLFPMTAYGKTAEMLQKHVIVGQMVTVSTRLISTKVAYDKQGTTHYRSQLLINVIDVVWDESKDNVLERQQKATTHPVISQSDSEFTQFLPFSDDTTALDCPDFHIGDEYGL